MHKRYMVHRIVTVDLCACIMHLKHPKLYITSFIVPLCEHLKGCQLQIRHFQNHCFKLRGYPDYRFGHQKFNQSSGRDVKWSVFVFHDLQQPDFWTCRKNKQMVTGGKSTEQGSTLDSNTPLPTKRTISCDYGFYSWQQMNGIYFFGISARAVSALAPNGSQKSCLISGDQTASQGSS